MTQPLSVLDLCAGIGGWTVALRERKLVDLAVENNAHAQAALVANGPGVYHDDMTTLLDDPTRVGVLRAILAGMVGSTPCQPFSQANLTRTGLRDARGVLTVAFIEIAVELRPPFVRLENVGKGTEQIFEWCAEMLRQEGYTAEQRLVCAADYGDAQARKRRLLVARRDGLPIAWPKTTHLDIRTGYGRVEVSSGRRKPWVTLAEILPKRTDLPDWAKVHPATTIVGSYKPECVAPPTYRKPGDGPRQNQPGVVVTSLEERLRIQGFPDGWHTFGPKTARGLQVGNAIPPTLARVALAAALDSQPGGIR